MTDPCDRCLTPIKGYILPGVFTAGYYNVTGAMWERFANPGEKKICDRCMWTDPRYIAVYGEGSARSLPPLVAVDVAEKAHRTSVVVTFEVEGLHCWPQARELEPEMGFLADPHRHIFHVRARKEVTHADRDVEFILLKRRMLAYLAANYEAPTGYSTRVHDFGARSCEMMATELLDVFELSSCEVLEDGENGAVVER